MPTQNGGRKKNYSSDSMALRTIVGVVFIAVGVLALLALLGVMQGVAFSMVRAVVHGLGGGLSYGIPIILTWGGGLIAVSARRRVGIRVFLLLIGFYLCLLALINLMSSTSALPLMDYIQRQNEQTLEPDPQGFVPFVGTSYTLCSLRGQGGGAIGMLLAWPLWHFMGTTAAIVVLVVLALVCAMFVSRFDFVGWLRRMREKSDAKLEERERLRAQREAEEDARTDRSLLRGEKPAFLRRFTRRDDESAQDETDQPMQPQTLTQAEAYAAYQQQMALFQQQQQQQFAYQQAMLQQQIAQQQQPIAVTPGGMYAPPMSATQPSGSVEIYDELVLPRDQQEQNPYVRRKKPTSGRKSSAKVEVLEPLRPAETEDNSRFMRPAAQANGGEAEQPNSCASDMPQLVNTTEAPRPATENLHDGKVNWEQKQAPHEPPTAEKKHEPVAENNQTTEPFAASQYPPQPVPVSAQSTARFAVPPLPSSAPSIPMSGTPLGDPQVVLPQRREPAREITGSATTPPYHFPPLDLLNTKRRMPPDTRAQDAKDAQHLQEVLKSFGIPAQVQRITHGPAVTRFELGLLSSGINVKKIANIADNIALEMASNGEVRIEVPIPGTNLFGIEIPNKEIISVTLAEVLVSDEMNGNESPLAVALGRDIAGKPIVCDLCKMPHLLIAGQTGSGKSVCVNSIINSILYRSTPEEVRMIMIDPKVVELQCYNVVPHLLIPVVSDPHKAAGALAWAVAEMLDRYQKIKTKNVRDITGYNKKLNPGEAKMPRIVIVVDELSDLMLACKKEVEESIIRLAQLARAAGIHLVIATQRPTVNVITGLIKANVPSRIAFTVANSTDSRTILDENGAEKLLGRGDMLYFPTGAPSPIRVQGCFLTDGEIENVVNFIADTAQTNFDENIIETVESGGDDNSAADTIGGDSGEGVDEKLPEAIEMVLMDGQASISMLQRRMKIGYARAGRLIDEMAQRGIISQSQGSKPREVLITREEYERIKETLQMP